MCDVTGADDGSCVREAVETQEASRDAVVQQERSHLQARRSTLSSVPRRRHAQVAHRRGMCTVCGSLLSVACVCLFVSQ